MVSAFLMACYLRGLDAGDARPDAGWSGRAARSRSSASRGRRSTSTRRAGSRTGHPGVRAARGVPRPRRREALRSRAGHTGGTLDKLEAILGLRTDLDPETFERQVEEVGCAVAAQTVDLVPADGKLYSLRDATATVPSIPLIASSVMSKKLAIGTDLILLDVKVGSGAFMKTVEDAGELAEACAALARDWGRACRVAVTDMSQPLGTAAGNALDVVETVELLHGRDRGRLREAALVFAAEAQVRLLGLDAGEEARRAERAWTAGTPSRPSAAWSRAQGGDPRVVDDPAGTLPAAPVVRPITALSDRFLASVETEAIGRPARISARGEDARATRSTPRSVSCSAEDRGPGRDRPGTRLGARAGRGRRGRVRGRGPGRLGVVRGAGRARAARARLVRVARRAGGGGGVESLKFAVFLAIGLVPSLFLHEYAHAFAADRLGDPSPRRWGRLGLNPRP